MSVLETPRILFRGEIAWDPITTNNYPAYYDETNDESVLPAAPTVQQQVAAFRQEAIDAVMTGSWNPLGTHRSSFYKTRISGVDLGQGLTKSDPFVASAANFTGMLVDVEPYGAYSSQLFFDAIRFGVDGGYRILGKRSTRMTARYINFNRNPANAMIAGVASVVWQTTFAKDGGLIIDAFDSPALQAINTALGDSGVRGLTVRFNTYRTIYYDNPALLNGSPLTVQMATKLNGKLNRVGGFQPNPARSSMVGVIGLWRESEPVHEPGDRALLPSAGSPLGSAHARISGKTLTIDLSNSVPELSKDLTKQDVGTIAVIAADANGQTTALGSLPYAAYDREAYDEASGIVTLPLTDAQVQAAAASDIRLLDPTGGVLLAEVALRAIPQDPNLYLDEDVQAFVRFQIYDRGMPAKTMVPVTMYLMSASNSAPIDTMDLKTNADGVLLIPIMVPTTGVFAYVPAPNNQAPPTNGLNTQLNTYMYVRILKADSATAKLTPTWDNVYAKVLANWNAMAPCMDNWLNLADPVQVKAYGPTLKRLTDPANFENFLFMPVTRDMTAGERTLLYAFLDARTDAAAPKLAATAPAGDSGVSLSQSMRRG